MGKYLLKRLFIFLPTLFAITLISFIISVNAPGDPVMVYLNAGTSSGGMDAERIATEELYLEKRKELGLHLPVFYFGLSTFAHPDTLYRIPKPQEKEALSKMINHYGNWPQISGFHGELKTLESKAYQTPTEKSLGYDLITIKNYISELLRSSEETEINFRVNAIDSLCNLHPGTLQSVQAQLRNVQGAYRTVQKTKSEWKTYIPSLGWYGVHNQYHRWLSHVIVGDLGKSYIGERKIRKILPEKMLWSFIINLFAIIISYVVSIPIGVHSAVRKNSRFERFVSTMLFVLYSLPSFWVATMLINFFANPDFFSWFPAVGVQDTMNGPDWPLHKRILDWAHHLILPTICYTYGTFAFLSRQMRVGMLESINQDYIRTARAKGLKERFVVWKHAFRNSLLPIITLFASIFPGMIGGSIILERIFTIPGMGQETLIAITQRDYPLIVAIFLIAAILTLVGILVADVLYAVSDPRISFSKKR